MKTFSSLTAATAILAGSADAFWRMECQARTGYSRLDPIVNPGEISSHAHAIHGGNNFGMNTNWKDLTESKCTSCRATQDNSAYWTPGLMFQHSNGTTQIVPQIGGMLAYYLLEKNAGETIEPFPEGFQMVAGDNRLRNFTGTVPDPEKSLWKADDKTQHALGQKAIGMNCLNYGKTPEPSMYRHFLPEKSYLDANCPQGIRAEIFFPSCWNGKKDSDNHRDHVAYPDLVNIGKCPKGYEKRLPSLFYETIWNTNAFKNYDGQFVFANGDPTGYGYHGDFMNGWKTDLLKEAINKCTNLSGRLEDCPVFELQSLEKQQKCSYEDPKELKNDQCTGPAKGLCGNVEIQYGPKYASSLTPGNPATPTAKPTSAHPTASQVPTLSHTSAKQQTSNAITVANKSLTEGSSKPTSAPSVVKPAGPPSAGKASSVKVADVAVKETSSAAPAPAPVPTKAPEAPKEPKGSIISTSTYTSAGAVYHVAIEEVVITVTAPAAAPSAVKPARRHAHVHMHNRRH